MVKKNPFTKEQGAYLYYIKRWKATGKGLPHACCPAHMGVEPTPRIHFGDFGAPLRRLSEVEFYLIALKNEGKTRGGPYPKLVKEARDLRALLLIEEDEAGVKEEKEEEEEAKEAKDADDVDTPTLLNEAVDIEDKLARERDERIRKEEGGGMATV